MELRVLKYFLTVARHENFSQAAEALHVTQPTLSRQLRELEEELGCQLLIRGKRKTLLTDAGKFLRNRAEEILALAERTVLALRESRPYAAGDVHIAGGETRSMALLAKVMKKTRDIYPNIKFHLYSGNAEAVSERLDSGLSDFGVFLRPSNLEKYEYINFPIGDAWGLLLRKDHPLAKMPCLRPRDIAKLDLICSAERMVINEIAGWLGCGIDQINIVATYTLLYNAALMVEAGMGAAICISGIADTSETSAICFRPLTPALGVNLYIAWKKRQAFSSAAQAFLRILRQSLSA